MKKKPMSKQIETESLAKRLNLLPIRSKKKLTKLHILKKRRIIRLQKGLKKQLKDKPKRKQI